MSWFLCHQNLHNLYSQYGCVIQYVLCLNYTPFTRYNRFDNRLYRVNKHPTGCQRVWRPVWCLFTWYSRLSNQFHNRFDNRVEQTTTVCCHCSFNRLSNWVVQPVWQLAVYTIQPVVKRVWQLVHDTTGCQTGLTIWQPVVSYTVVYKHLTGC